MVVQAQYEKSTFIRECGGGYGIPADGRIKVEKVPSRRRRQLVTIHEVLELYLARRVRHGRIDKIAIDIIDALQQLRLLD